NAINWCECDRVRCANTQSANGDGRCVLCCNSDVRLHRMFMAEILPAHRYREYIGEEWHLNTSNAVISQIGRATDAGGTWRIVATLESNIERPRLVEIYIRVERNQTLFPLTLGYFVADFNAFNMGQ
ncbi:MAG: hypothetical protein FWC83_02160, partial [Alphaproteobacteria bacterium]|nr:hypothetical protein [Alphaproteobacteria bacterium]